MHTQVWITSFTSTSQLCITCGQKDELQQSYSSYLQRFRFPHSVHNSVEQGSRDAGFRACPMQFTPPRHSLFTGPTPPADNAPPPRLHTCCMLTALLAATAVLALLTSGPRARHGRRDAGCSRRGQIRRFSG